MTLPVQIMLQKLGVSTLILTAATGGIRADLRAGNLVLLTDHLNLIGSGRLRGQDDLKLDTRFPDMTEVFIRATAVDCQRKEESWASIMQDIYACYAGPSYETPAEIKMLRFPRCRRGGRISSPRGHRRRDADIEVLAFTALVSKGAAGAS